LIDYIGLLRLSWLTAVWCRLGRRSCQDPFVERRKTSWADPSAYSSRDNAS